MNNKVALKILNTEKDKLMLESEATRDWELISALDIAIEAVNEIGNYGNCVLTMFGDCSYEETGCSDCKIIEKIGEALKNDCYKEGYSQGYIDGSTGADWRCDEE